MELGNGTYLKGDNYQILFKIAQGNFGITYLGEQTSLGRKVCIKEFFFRGFCERNSNGSVTITNSGKEQANSFRRKFIREAKRLSQFDHPNIVKVIDVFEENGTAYMVMDYIEGETLQQLVDRKGKLSESEALEYIIPLCDALEVVHEKGLLHLDIKPSNILVKKKTNTPVLIDFGISKFTEVKGEDHSTTTPVALTKGYAPLEQYGQDLAKLTAATDVYSVAATLYKMVTGVTPPEAAVIVQDGIKTPRELNSAVSEKLNAIIILALSVKTNQRPQSISKLKTDLLEISRQAPIQAIEEVTEVIKIDEIHNPKNHDSLFSVSTEINEDPEPKGKKSIYSWLPIFAIFIGIIIIIAFISHSDTSNEIPNTDTSANKVERNYDFVSNYSEGLAKVRKGNKWGYINKNGTLIIPEIYDEAGVFSGGKSSVKMNGRWTEIDKNGKEIKNTGKKNQPIVNDKNNANGISTSRRTIIYEDPVTDIDGNVYKTVRIGKQVWMAENLKVSHYQNGDLIPNVMDKAEWANLTSGAWCLYENNIKNGYKYGKLYNWYAVSDNRDIAPRGWHVSNQEDWTTLLQFIKNSGDKLKSKSGWTDFMGKIQLNFTDDFGFCAMPGGYCTDGMFYALGYFGQWWSAEQSSSIRVTFWYLSGDQNDLLSRSGNWKRDGFSVRCLRDY